MKLNNLFNLSIDSKNKIEIYVTLTHSLAFSLLMLKSGKKRVSSEFWKDACAAFNNCGYKTTLIMHNYSEIMAMRSL